MKKVIFTPKAKDSLANIYHYIAFKNKDIENANRFIDELITIATDVLSTSPKAGRSIGNNIRFIVHKKYTITYTIVDDNVLIGNIYRGQNWRIVD